MGKNRWSHVVDQDVASRHKISTYKEMIKFSQEKTGKIVDSVMPGIRMFGGPKFRFMFKKMMINKGYEFTKEKDEIELKNRIPRPRSSMNKTGVKDCYLEKGKYRIQVSINGKRKYVGRYASIDEAREARKAFIIKNNLNLEI